MAQTGEWMALLLGEVPGSGDLPFFATFGVMLGVTDLGGQIYGA